MATPVAVGVDNGGTWIRLKGLNASGRCVWSLKKLSPTVADLPAFLRKHLKGFHGELSALAVGSRGVWKQGKRRRLTRALQGLANHVIVMSDVEAAWLAAFKDEGIIVISGTGSIAYGRASDGKYARAGGLGPQKGDEGSGYWIGKKWLLTSPLSQRERVQGEGARSVRQIAALTPNVIRKAKAGNPIAHQIIQEAQAHLINLVEHLINELHLKGKVPLSVSGSVLENEWFRSGLLRQLKQKGITYRYIRKTIDPAIAALL
jgi:N-acetylglucosamine kinase-like BadF-type ATPase